MRPFPPAGGTAGLGAGTKNGNNRKKIVGARVVGKGKEPARAALDIEDRIHEDVVISMRNGLSIDDTSLTEAHTAVHNQYGVIGFRSEVHGSVVSHVPFNSVRGSPSIAGSQIANPYHPHTEGEGEGEGGGGLGYGVLGIGDNSSLLREPSVVQRLWAKASECNHPLKLQLRDSLADVHYLPMKRKTSSATSAMHMGPASRGSKDDANAYAQAQVQEVPGLSSRSEGPAHSQGEDGGGGGEREVTQAIQKRVASLLKKPPLRGIEADIAARLLAPYKTGEDAEKANNIAALHARIQLNRSEAKKAKALDVLRSKAIKDGNYVSDDVLLGLAKHPSVIAAELAAAAYEEFMRNDDGSAAFDESSEPCHASLWADSGPLMGCRAMLAFQKKVWKRRWMVVAALASAQSHLSRQVLEERERVRLAAEEARRYIWTEADSAASLVQVAWRNKQRNKVPSAPSDTLRPAHVSRWDRLRMLMSPARLNKLPAISVGSAPSRAKVTSRVSAANLIRSFLEEVFKSNRLKSTITVFVNGIRQLQGYIRRHLQANKARVAALTRAFDCFAARMGKHVHALCEDKGLDLLQDALSDCQLRGHQSSLKSNKERALAAEKAALLRDLRSDLLAGHGKASLDAHVNCLRGMKTASFHRKLRAAVPRKDSVEGVTSSSEATGLGLGLEGEGQGYTLEELDFHWQFRQGRFMLDRPLQALDPAPKIVAPTGIARGASIAAPSVVAGVGAAASADGGGSLVDPQIRRQVLWRFMAKRRKEFVFSLQRLFRAGDVVARKLPNVNPDKMRIREEPLTTATAAGTSAAAAAKGAGGAGGASESSKAKPAGASLKPAPDSSKTATKKKEKKKAVSATAGGGAAASDDEDSTSAFASATRNSTQQPQQSPGKGARDAMHITLEQVRRFVQSADGIDPLSSKLDWQQSKRAESLRLYAWQRRTRMCNLTCLTTWDSMLRDVQPADFMSLFLEMVESTRRLRIEVGAPAPSALQPHMQMPATAAAAVAAATPPHVTSIDATTSMRTVAVPPTAPKPSAALAPPRGR